MISATEVAISDNDKQRFFGTRQESQPLVDRRLFRHVFPVTGDDSVDSYLSTPFHFTRLKFLSVASRLTASCVAATAAAAADACVPLSSVWPYDRRSVLCAHVFMLRLIPFGIRFFRPHPSNEDAHTRIFFPPSAKPNRSLGRRVLAFRLLKISVPLRFPIIRLHLVESLSSRPGKYAYSRSSVERLSLLLIKRKENLCGARVHGEKVRDN